MKLVLFRSLNETRQMYLTPAKRITPQRAVMPDWTVDLSHGDYLATRCMSYLSRGWTCTGGWT